MHDAAFAPLPQPSLNFVCDVEASYRALIAFAPSANPSEPAAERSLGGSLLYVGDLADSGKAWMVASNIAGAASVVATEDLNLQKQAVHEGIADFLVTSLDEALRILKNEIRKKQTVAVCIARSPEAVEREMIERGVLPDFVIHPEHAHSFGRDSQLVQRKESDDRLITLQVASAPAKWLSKLDALILDAIAHDEQDQASVTRRWLRLAPRYLGRVAHNFRTVRLNPLEVERISEGIRNAVAGGEIGTAVDVQVTDCR